MALTKTEPGDDGPENGTLVHVTNVQEETSNYFPKVAALSLVFIIYYIIYLFFGKLFN